MSILASSPPNIAQFWSRAHAMFARAARIIGAVQALAALTTLTRARRREISGWLGLIETIVRKLIFAEAVELHRGAISAGPHAPSLEHIAFHSAPQPAPSLAPSPRAPQARAFDPNQPHTWPARFKLAAPKDPKACPESRAPRVRALWGESSAPPPRKPPRGERTPTPWRLALRLEALRRVLADPAPYARRLARLLPRLRAAFAERYALATAPRFCIDHDDSQLIIDALSLALGAASLFLNTS